MFPAYPTMDIWPGQRECTARINRNCTGRSTKEIRRLSLGKEGYHDLCERCEQTYRRRYNRAMNRFYDAAMAGEIKGPWGGRGGVFVIG